jgi:hypothetical protein
VSSYTEACEEVGPCGCDFVQIIVDNGETFELHHVIPDDGVEHTLEPNCPCDPAIERVEHDWIVIGHHDQDLA